MSKPSPNQPAHFRLHGQGAFTEDTHWQIQGGELCQSMGSSWGLPQSGCHWKKLCFQAIHPGKEAAPKPYLVKHCKRQTHCDFGAAVERRQILHSALSRFMLVQHKSAQAGILQQSCPLATPLLPTTYLFALKEGRRRKGDKGSGRGSRLQLAAADVFIVF